MLMHMDLTSKEKLYVDAYVEARKRALPIARCRELGAVAASYSVKNAHASGYQVERKPAVAAALSAALADVETNLALDKLTAESRAGVSLEWVLRSLKAVAERCMAAVPVLDADGAPIGEYKFDATGANGALKVLLSYLEHKEDRRSGYTPATFQLFMAGATSQQLTVLNERD